MSIQFWRFYKKQTALIMVIIVLSTVVMLDSLLLMRGEKYTAYSNAMDGDGNYDYLMFDMQKAQRSEAKKYFDQVSFVYALSDITINNETLKAACMDSDV